MNPFGGMAARLQRDRLKAEGLGQHNNAIKYLNQDYEALKQECVESGTPLGTPSSQLALLPLDSRSWGHTPARHGGWNGSVHR